MCKKSFYRSVDNTNKQKFKNDIKKIENIVNELNIDFNMLLPEAQHKRQLLLNKIRKNIVPKKAKFIDNEKVK